jgi:phosphoglycerate-specific signal transduction histidine kinase
MNYSRIINETINRYMNNIIKEAEENNYQKSLQHSQDLKRERGENLSQADEKELRNVLQDPAINVAAIAREVYPELTDGGAQSQLQKKIDGKHNDEGSEYHLTTKEASVIRRELPK